MTKSRDLVDELVKEGPKAAFPRPEIVAIRWLFLIAIYFAAMISISGFRYDILEKIVQPLYFIEVAFMLLTAVLATYASSFLALPDVNQKLWIRFAPLISLTFLIGILIEGIFSKNSLSLTECIKSGHHECFIHLLLYSIFPTTIMLYSMHKAAPIRFLWAGSMVGLSAASFGYISLRLIEKNDEPSILLVWHFIPIIVAIIIGMMVGKIYLSRIWR